jgi:signal transduction histidine kinase
VIRSSRTTLAGALTLVAIAVPSTAWYIAGGDATRREAERLVSETRVQAQQVADGLAERLTIRLQRLLNQESERPAVHYVAHFSDPDSDCGCAVVSSSPLAVGNADPLVWSHFQVAPDRWLTVPGLAAAEHLDECTSDVSLNESFDPSAMVDQLRRRDLLQQDVGTLTGDMTLRVRGYAGWTESDSTVFVPAIPIESESVFAVGPFGWRTMEISGVPSLAAVRRVTTTVGDLAQGFVIANDALQRDLAGALFPSRVVAEADTTEGGDALLRAPILLAGVGRWIEVDAGDALLVANAEGDRLVTRFRRGFIGITLAALLAGLSVIGLVAQTERLARQRAQFAAAAAHELRTPLAGLRVYADMVGENLGDPTQSAKYARQLATEVERLGRVVTNMLGYARLERGAVAVDLREDRLERVTSDAVERLRPAIEKTGAVLTFEAEPDLPAVRLDADAMFRVVQNLIDNAEKHTREAADRSIEVRVGARGSGVAIAVRDRGPGIPPGRRAQMFRAFVRGTEGAPSPGLGLGLPLARGLVEAHGGSITYADVAGGGAEFTVLLPAV